jgi:hypothetical protein
MSRGLLLETPTPAERLAYVPHDMFSVPFDEIGAIPDRSPDARASSPAADAAASAVRTRPSTPTRPHSERALKPSSPPRATETSTPSSPCSIPTSWSARTPAAGNLLLTGVENGYTAFPHGPARKADVSDGSCLGPGRLPCPGGCRPCCSQPDGSPALRRPSPVGDERTAVVHQQDQLVSRPACCHGRSRGPT